MIKEIASIYPIEQKATRTLYGGNFVLPAGHKDKDPVTIVIRDHVQIEPLPYFYAAPGSGKQPKARILINAIDIANDLVREWSTTVIGQTLTCHPGIWVVRDTIPMFNDDGSPMMTALGPQEMRPATTEERAEMFDQDWEENKTAQANWAEYCIQMGDIAAENPKAIIFIPDYSKILCRHYGRDRKWLRALKDNDVKKCPFCRGDIDIEATVCKHCTTDLTSGEIRGRGKKKEAVA